MARKSEEPVALERSTQKPRRRRWWIIPLIVVGLVVIGGLLWINQIGIRRWLGDTFTAATPLPTAGASEAGVFYETDFNAPEAAADWEIFDDGTISSKVEDGRLVVGVHAFTHTGTWSGLNLSFESFVLDVEATKLDGPDDNGICRSGAYGMRGDQERPPGRPNFGSGAGAPKLSQALLPSCSMRET